MNFRFGFDPVFFQSLSTFAGLSNFGLCLITEARVVLKALDDGKFILGSDFASIFSQIVSGIELEPPSCRKDHLWPKYRMELNRTSAESSISGSEEESEGELTPPSVLEGSSDPNGPRKRDVLLGRGKPFQNFSGNRRMLRIVSQFKGEYAARPRDQKRLYVETALEAVLKDGARFLRRVDVADGTHRWEEVDRTAAAEKVWHVLRSKGEGRSRKSRQSSEQGEDHAQNDQTHLSTVEAVDNAGENPTNGNFSYQRAQGTQPGMSMQHLSLVQSLSNTLLQHLSNATAAAALLAAVTTGQAQLPQPPPPAAENASVSSSQDASAQNLTQVLVGELLRAQVQGTTLNQLSGAAHLQAYQNAMVSNASNPAAAVTRGPPTAAPPFSSVMPPNMSVSQMSHPQQNQLIQIITSMLRGVEQFHPPQQPPQRQPPASNPSPRNLQPQL